MRVVYVHLCLRMCIGRRRQRQTTPSIHPNHNQSKTHPPTRPRALGVGGVVRRGRHRRGRHSCQRGSTHHGAPLQLQPCCLLRAGGGAGVGGDDGRGARGQQRRGGPEGAETEGWDGLRAGHLRGGWWGLGVDGCGVVVVPELRDGGGEGVAPGAFVVVGGGGGGKGRGGEVFSLCLLSKGGGEMGAWA